MRIGFCMIGAVKRLKVTDYFTIRGTTSVIGGDCHLLATWGKGPISSDLEHKTPRLGMAGAQLGGSRPFRARTEEAGNRLNRLW
jgi:hypothetical protein